MSEFKVKPGTVKSAAVQNEQIARELEQISSGVYGIRRRLRFQIAQRERINRRLDATAQKISSEGSSSKRTASVLKSVANQYEKTELELCGEKENNILQDLISRPLYATEFVRLMVGSDNGNSESQESSEGSNSQEDESTHSLLEDIYLKFKHNSKKAKDFKKEHTEEIRENRYTFDTTTKKWTKFSPDGTEEAKKAANDAFDDNLKSGKIDMGIGAGIAGSIAGELWKSEGEVSNDWASASYTASLAEGKLSADGYVGLYQKNPTTGKMEFKPGIGGKLGASFSAFTAEEKAELGNDMLGGYVKSTQTVGRAKGEVEASIGLYDSSGKFNPSAYGGLSAEVIAGEITGEAGLKILGTDASVSGSLNYGFGVHANAGYKDGKLSLDLGATLGVGASVKVEVDIGGTVKAVCDKASSICSGIKSWFK